MDAILDYLIGLNPIVQALLATLFTWAVTALGASFVFFAKNVNQRVLDFMMGFAAGVMIAASFWSLLAPSIEKAEETFLLGQGPPAWVPAAVGFMAGALFLFVVDKIIPHLHVGFRTEEAEGIKTTWHRSILLVLAITLHNIPEGLAVGVAFGALASEAVVTPEMLAPAVALAIGIGLQNFPEGLAVSMPLRREGFSRRKSFWYGQLSGVVEPVAGVIGAAAVILMQPILPYALSFAAGAMIFVVVEELIPESHRKGNTDLATMGAMIGFTVMMVMDVALG
jgi:ZIP family zinc transporter